MKKSGLICSILGGICFIVSLVLRGGSEYQESSTVTLWFGGGKSAYNTTVDIVFYIGIVALIAGIILLIIGYNKNKKAI
jgi:hypothetical protein